MKKDDQAISQRAYEIWQSEGQPEGRHDDHWHQASNELKKGKSAKTGSTTKAAAKPKKATKPATAKTTAKSAEKPTAKKDDVAAARSKIKIA